MIVIKICDMSGFYYVEEETLLYCQGGNRSDDVQVSDLTELKIWQYNQLVRDLNEMYPNFDIKYLKGKYI